MLTLELSSSDSTAGAAKDKNGAKAVSKKVKSKKKKRVTIDGEEAGEDTDEGDMESREVDYMTDSSSNSELEFLVMDHGVRVPPSSEGESFLQAPACY